MTLGDFVIVFEDEAQVDALVATLPDSSFLRPENRSKQSYCQACFFDSSGNPILTKDGKRWMAYQGKIDAAGDEITIFLQLRDSNLISVYTAAEWRDSTRNPMRSIDHDPFAVE